MVHVTCVYVHAGCKDMMLTMFMPSATLEIDSKNAKNAVEKMKSLTQYNCRENSKYDYNGAEEDSDAYSSILGHDACVCDTYCSSFIGLFINA